MMGVITRCCRVIESVIGLALAVMVVLVFSNVVLRYAFNSGIAISEELARWLFIWVTFLGAVVALHQREHMGTDLLVRLLPLWARRVCLGLGQCLMLYICYLLWLGMWQQMTINWDTRSAAMEVSVAWFYGAGAVFAALAGMLLLLQLARLLSGKATAEELGFAAKRDDEGARQELQA